jgi:hypothetical protein
MGKKEKGRGAQERGRQGETFLAQADNVFCRMENKCHDWTDADWLAVRGPSWSRSILAPADRRHSSAALAEYDNHKPGTGRTSCALPPCLLPSNRRAAWDGTTARVLCTPLLFSLSLSLSGVAILSRPAGPQG